MRAYFRDVKRDILHGQPAGFMLRLAVWILLNAASILLSDNLFAKVPMWLTLAEMDQRLGIPENFWGYLMLVNGLLVLSSVFRPASAWAAALATMTGAFWLFIGVQASVSGYLSGFFSAIGPWDIVLSVWSFVAAIQTINCRCAKWTR